MMERAAEPPAPARVFRYRARDANGTRRTGSLRGRSESDVAAALRAKGLFPVMVVPDDDPAIPDTPAARRGTLSTRQAADLIGRLARLTGRQITMDRALAIISEGGDRRIAAAAAGLRGAMREGTPLSQALPETGGVGDPVTVALVSGAEASGEMDEALATAAAILEGRVALSRRILTGLLYPGILLFVALLSLGLVMVAIIPQFRPLIADRFELVPPLGRAVFALSDVANTVWPFVLAGLIGAGIATVIAARRGMLGRVLSGLARRLPYARRLILRNQMTMTLQILAALLSREVTLSAALKVVQGSAPPGPLGARLGEVRRQVEAGGALSTALAERNLMSRDAVEMIRIGEETGSLAEMVARSAADLREAADRDLERFLVLFQPALIVGVGLMIGVSLYALFSAIVSVNAISF